MKLLSALFSDKISLFCLYIAAEALLLLSASFFVWIVVMPGGGLHIKIMRIHQAQYALPYRHDFVCLQGDVYPLAAKASMFRDLDHPKISVSAVRTYAARFFAEPRMLYGH